MQVKNATVQDLIAALAKVNQTYAGNICWKRPPELVGKRVRFTLRVNDSKGPGALVRERRTVAACWHVHGRLFEELLKLSPTAEISACGHKITAAGGNWQDRNIGSQVRPLYYSEACRCGERGLA